jgi:hypothetical protein
VLLANMKFNLIIIGAASFAGRVCASSGQAPGSDFEAKEGPIDASTYFPWTHKPVCTESIVEQNEQLCVYTSASFSNGRGISIFTRPSIAAQFVALLPFENPAAVPKDINPPANSKRQPWKTAQIDGKGMGLVATRKLKRGDLVMAHTPFLLSHMENVLSTMERERFLRIAVDQLPKESQEIYLNLAKIYNEPSVVIQDVVKANAFEISVGGTQHLAVFPEASRYNHDCAPK